jgi:NhaA family Na+:H+ antiporter
MLPGILYAIVNTSGVEARGWAIPTATDIAFSLGVLSLVGSRVPYGAKLFLATLAIADDLAAIVIIALFYTGEIHTGPLLIALGLIGVLTLLNIGGVKNITPYLLIGMVLWMAMLGSGVHATLSGVILAFSLPATGRQNRDGFGKILATANQELGAINRMAWDKDSEFRFRSLVKEVELACEHIQPPAQHIENFLHHWVTYFILPVFALANAGVVLSSETLNPFTNTVSTGVMLGLLIGKPLGIMAAVWLVVRLKLGNMPTGVNFKQMTGVAILCGIGFTMSIFVSDLAMAGHTDLLSSAKAAVIFTSAAMAIIGWAWLKLTLKDKSAA